MADRPSQPWLGGPRAWTYRVSGASSMLSSLGSFADRERELYASDGESFSSGATSLGDIDSDTESLHGASNQIRQQSLMTFSVGTTASSRAPIGPLTLDDRLREAVGESAESDLPDSVLSVASGRHRGTSNAPELTRSAMNSTSAIVPPDRFAIPGEEGPIDTVYGSMKETGITPASLSAGVPRPPPGNLSGAIRRAQWEAAAATAAATAVTSTNHSAGSDSSSQHIGLRDAVPVILATNRGGGALSAIRKAADVPTLPPPLLTLSLARHPSAGPHRLTWACSVGAMPVEVAEALLHDVRHAKGTGSLAHDESLLFSYAGPPGQWMAHGGVDHAGGLRASLSSHSLASAPSLSAGLVSSPGGASASQLRRDSDAVTPSSFRTTVWAAGSVGPALDALSHLHSLVAMRKVGSGGSLLHGVTATGPVSQGSLHRSFQRTATSGGGPGSPVPYARHTYQHMLVSTGVTSPAGGGFGFSRNAHSLLIHPQTLVNAGAMSALAAATSSGASGSVHSHQQQLHQLHSTDARGKRLSSPAARRRALAMTTGSALPQPALFSSGHRDSNNSDDDAALADPSLHLEPTVARGLGSKRIVAASASWAQALLLTATGDVYQWRVSSQEPLMDPPAAAPASEPATSNSQRVAEDQPGDTTDDGGGTGEPDFRTPLRLARGGAGAGRQQSAPSASPADGRYHSDTVNSEGGGVSPIAVGPVLVQALAWERALRGVRIVAVACGPLHCVALGSLPTADVYTWGAGADGRLGHGSMRDEPSPRLVAALIPFRVTSIAAGGAHTAAVTLGTLESAYVEAHQRHKLSQARGASGAASGASSTGDDRSVRTVDEDRSDSASVATDSLPQHGPPQHRIGRQSSLPIMHGHSGARPRQASAGGAALFSEGPSSAPPTAGRHGPPGLLSSDASVGALWTWGRGRGGRLGHGDEADQWEPKRVRGIVRVAHRVLHPSAHVTTEDCAAASAGAPGSGPSDQPSTVVQQQGRGGSQRASFESDSMGASPSLLPASGNPSSMSAEAAAPARPSTFASRIGRAFGGSSSGSAPVSAPAEPSSSSSPSSAQGALAVPKRTPAQIADDARIGAREDSPSSSVPPFARGMASSRRLGAVTGGGAAGAVRSYHLAQGAGRVAAAAASAALSQPRRERAAVTQVSLGRSFTVCVTADGDVWAWGNSSHGQTGVDAKRQQQISGAPRAVGTDAAAPAADLPSQSPASLLLPTRVVFPSPRFAQTRRQVAACAVQAADALEPLVRSLACPYPLLAQLPPGAAAPHPIASASQDSAQPRVKRRAAAPTAHPADGAPFPRARGGLVSTSTPSQASSASLLQRSSSSRTVGSTPRGQGSSRDAQTTGAASLAPSAATAGGLLDSRAFSSAHSRGADRGASDGSSDSGSDDGQTTHTGTLSDIDDDSSGGDDSDGHCAGSDIGNIDSVHDLRPAHARRRQTGGAGKRRFRPRSAAAALVPVMNAVEWATGVHALQTSPHTTSPAAPTPSLDDALEQGEDAVRIVRVSAGHSHVLACARDGTLWSWGLNAYGQLGVGRDFATHTPEQVPVSLFLEAHASTLNAPASAATASQPDAGGDPAASAEADEAHVSRATWEAANRERRKARLPTGRASAQGCIRSGSPSKARPTISTTAKPPAPSHPLTLHGSPPAYDPVVAVYTGAFHSVAVTAGGAVLAWGRNHEGQLGVGDARRHRTPEPVQVQVRVVVQLREPSLLQRQQVQVGSPELGAQPSAGAAGHLFTPHAHGKRRSRSSAPQSATPAESLPPFTASKGSRGYAVVPTPADDASAYPASPQPESSPEDQKHDGVVTLSASVLRVGRPWRRLLDVACGKDFTLFVEAPAPVAPQRATSAPSPARRSGRKRAGRQQSAASGAGDVGSESDGSGAPSLFGADLPEAFAAVPDDLGAPIRGRHPSPLRRSASAGSSQMPLKPAAPSAAAPPVRRVRAPSSVSDAASGTASSSVSGFAQQQGQFAQPAPLDPQVTRARDAATASTALRGAEEAARASLSDAWETVLGSMTGSWEAFMASDSSLQALWRRGVPPHLRCRVWPLAIGNALRVTPASFEMYRQRAASANLALSLQRQAEERDEAQKLQQPQASCGRELTSPGLSAGDHGSYLPPDEAAVADVDTSALSPTSRASPVGPLLSPSTRGGIPRDTHVHRATAHLAQQHQSASVSLSQLLMGVSSGPAVRAMLGVGLVGREDTLRLIPTDLPRTFPSLHLFGPPGSASEGPLHGILRDVLEAFVAFRPELGYVQGMSYLAAMLVLATAGTSVTAASRPRGDGSGGAGAGALSPSSSDVQPGTPGLGQSHRYRAVVGEVSGGISAGSGLPARGSPLSKQASVGGFGSGGVGGSEARDAVSSSYSATLGVLGGASGVGALLYRAASALHPIAGSLLHSRSLFSAGAPGEGMGGETHASGAPPPAGVRGGGGGPPGSASRPASIRLPADLQQATTGGSSSPAEGRARALHRRGAGPGDDPTLHRPHNAPPSIALAVADDRYVAFQCLCNLLSRHHLYVFYAMDPGPLVPFYELFERLLAHRNRPLAAHLAACGVITEMYLFGWLQTVFLKCLPLPSAARVWDGFLLEGTPFLYRAAVAICDLLAPTILRDGGAPPDETIQLLTQPPAMRRHWEGAWAAITPPEVLLPAVDAVVLPQSIALELEDLAHDPFFYRRVVPSGSGAQVAGRGGRSAPGAGLMSASLASLGLFGGPAHGGDPAASVRAAGGEGTRMRGDGGRSGSMASSASASCAR